MDSPSVKLPTAVEGDSPLGDIIGKLSGASTGLPVSSAVNVELKLQCRLAYSIEELATAVSLSRSTIYESINDGTLIARRVGDRRTVITLIDAIAWLQARPPVRDSRKPNHPEGSIPASVTPVRRDT